MPQDIPTADRWPAREVAAGTWLIDLGFQRVAGTIGAFLLAGEGDLALVETGPTTTIDGLRAGVLEAGHDLGDVTRLIVSHIHLDHAGAAGALMREFPRMRLSVHETGASFLIDPERLVSSASRIFGTRMERLWGEVVPIDADRVDPMRDGDVLEVAGRDLLVRHAPGHAGSHVVVLDRSTGVLFTGDAAGARLQGTGYVCPTLVPPELDVEVWARTIEMMRAMQPRALAVTHCGVFDDVDQHLGAVIPNLEEQIAIGEQVIHTPDDADDVIPFLEAQEREEYAREGASIAEVTAFMRAMGLAMPPYVAAQGLRRLFKVTGRFPA
jgi:glyoxylase-like metal-dependent hydrolase (beta-lactamase superfamily II)